MHTWYLSITAKIPVLFAVLAGLALDSVTGQAQVQENLPPLPANSVIEPQNEGASEGNRLCPTLEDPPLSALVIDIRPRGTMGQLVPASDTPVGCWEQNGMAGPVLFISGGCGCYLWGCHDLLQLARFCHRPLYFEDPLLERYGVVSCCPAVHSVARFACDLVLLPAKLLVHTRHPYVRTPTPYCCPPY